MSEAKPDYVLRTLLKKVDDLQRSIAGAAARAADLEEGAENSRRQESEMTEELDALVVEIKARGGTWFPRRDGSPLAIKYWGAQHAKDGI